MHPQRPGTRQTVLLVTAFAVALPVAVRLEAAEHPGLAIYRERCARCHGADGSGTTAVPEPLVGDRSVAQLAVSIERTMPEDDPGTVTGDAARQVADYVHGAFYSAVARDRNRPARIELSRLTVRQHRTVLSDLVASFRGAGPPVDDRRGLRGRYFAGGSSWDFGTVALERTDPRVDFDFGVAAPGPQPLEPNRFAISWTGAIVPPETGVYEFVLRSDHRAWLALHTDISAPRLIDAVVKSGTEGLENRASVFLLGGRSYPLRISFAKILTLVDKTVSEEPTRASIALLWKPPHGVLETVPERVLLPDETPPVFVPSTPFPPDDTSIGYERGSMVSEEWFAATAAAAIETADHVLANLPKLAGVDRDAPDRDARLRDFAATFAERAVRRPLSPELRALLVDRPFTEAPDADTAVRRSLLLVLQSPRFLFRGADADDGSDSFDVAERLSFGLWDSLPDEPLWQAARAGSLSTPEQVREQAERMVRDRRTRAKVRDFLFAWLRVDLGADLVKDQARHPGFTPAVAADLRTSLDLFLDEAVWKDGDYRRLFTADEIHLNGRLAPLYGVSLPPDADFRGVRLDEGRRGGLLSHPYMMSVLSYADTTSPIHRGVFLARNIFGNLLRPPQEAVPPLAPEEHPELTTRQRVALQTRGVACQGCHTMINPLGFALEEFDEIGRLRTTELAGGEAKPVDASGSYVSRDGGEASFRGGRELAAFAASSRDAQEAFVQGLFHAVVKQPVRAWGPDTLADLRASFAAADFDVRRLLVDIATLAALPPKVVVASTGGREHAP